MNTAWRRARLKRPDDVTTAESNPAGFRFTIPNQLESIIPSSSTESAAAEAGMEAKSVKVSMTGCGLSLDAINFSLSGSAARLWAEETRDRPAGRS